MYIGHCTINGVPHVNMKPCSRDEEISDVMLLDGALTCWRCPECQAQMGPADDRGVHVCLNMCGFSSASARRFNALMADAAAKVRRREMLLAGGGIVDALGDIANG